MFLTKTKSVHTGGEQTYDVQIISSVQQIRAVYSDWDEFLTKEATRHTYWQDPNIIQFHLESTAREDAQIFLIRKNTKLVCIAPCIITQTRFRLNFSIFRIPGPRLRILKILDSDFIFSQDADITKCIECIFFKIKSLHSFDLIYLENLRCSSSFYRIFASKKYYINGFQLRFTSPKTEKIWRHVLQESYETWLATLRRKTRGTIRRHIRRLEKNYPDQIKFMKITQVEEVPKFLMQLDQLFPKTWQAKTFGYKKRNSTKEITSFTNIAQKGWLRSYMMLIQNKPVAFIVGFQYNGIFEYSECGYDPEYSSKGVGSVLNYFMLQDLYETDKPKILDFGFGENQYKKIIGNDECDAYEAYITFNKWGLLIKLQTILSFMEKILRFLFVKLHLDGILRNFLKKR